VLVVRLRIQQILQILESGTRFPHHNQLQHQHFLHNQLHPQPIPSQHWQLYYLKHNRITAYIYSHSNYRQPAAAAIDPQKLAIIQLLLQQGVSLEQVATLLNTQQPQQSQYPVPPRGRRSRSRSRSPPPRRRSPSRSISPPARGRGRGRRRDSFDSPPPRRRRSPSYDDYRMRSPSRSRSPPQARRRNSPHIRERSPLRKLPAVTDEKDYKPRFVEYDESLKPDRIRGISRQFTKYLL
jgi:DNA-binding transcriptional MerR regulator